MSRVVCQRRFLDLTLASVTTTIVVVVLCLSCQNAAFGQTEEQQIKLRAQALTSHNTLREMYVSDPDLVLPTSGTDVNTVLNTGSANWAVHLASTGDFAHSSDADRTIASSGDVAGENIFSLYTSVALSPAELAKMAVASWYSEIGNYSYLKPLDTKVGTTGHFTQVIWVSTTTVGCGFGVSPDPNNTMYNTYIVVCRYDPPGNLQDTAAYAANVPMLIPGKS
jgi:glioma pathogenesis-related protein 2